MSVIAESRIGSMRHLNPPGIFVQLINERSLKTRQR